MKKFFGRLDFQGWLFLLSPVILVVFLIADLSGCADVPTKQEIEMQENYDIGWQSGFDSGYEAGLDDAEFDIDDFSFSDHPELLDEAKWRLEDEASDYARKKGGWTPEEALEIIDAYENREPFWQDGSPPSDSDYREAVRTLYCFYEYFY